MADGAGLDHLSEDGVGIMMAEYNNPQYAQDRPAIAREMARLGISIPQDQPQGAQAIGAMGSPEADAALAASDQAPQGALSQVAAQPMQQPAQMAPAAGPLSQVPQFKERAPIDMQAMLAQFVPQDDSSSKYLAMAAAFGRPTGFGTLGETMSNVASALQEQKMNQQKLRAQYVPMIMQQVAAQQARDENHQFMAQQAAIAAQQHRENLQMQLGSQQQMSADRLDQTAQLTEAGRTQTAAIAAGNLGVRQDAVNTQRASIISKLSAQFPFDTPQQLKARADAMFPPMQGGPANGQAPIGDQTSNPDSPPTTPIPSLQGLAGQDLFNALPDKAKPQVQALLDGRKSYPVSMGLRDPYTRQLIEWAAQVDPEFDQTDFNKRNKTAMAFATGEPAQKMRIVGTALGHMGTMANDISNLNNFGGVATGLNYLANPLAKATGQPEPGSFETTAHALAGELRKVYSGTSAGNLEELRNWESSFNVNASPVQQKAYLAKAAELLYSQIDSLQNQYKTGMGTSRSVFDSTGVNGEQLINPVAKTVLANFTNGDYGPHPEYMHLKPPIGSNPVGAPVANDQSKTINFGDLK